MRIKLQGGPAANTVYDVPDYTDDYFVRVNDPAKTGLKFDVYAYDYVPTYKEGSYHRSNTKLKNGTWVFKWMGWKS